VGRNRGSIRASTFVTVAPSAGAVSEASSITIRSAAAAWSKWMLTVEELDRRDRPPAPRLVAPGRLSAGASRRNPAWVSSCPHPHSTSPGDPGTQARPRITAACAHQNELAASEPCYDAVTMRTTLSLDDDALELARQLARRKRMTLGRAVSELVRRAARSQLPTSERHGLTLVRLPEHTPRVTAATVEDLLDERP